MEGFLRKKKTLFAASMLVLEAGTSLINLVNFDNPSNQFCAQ